MPFNMKTRLLLLLLLMLLSPGCTQTPLLESNSADSPNKTKLGDLPPKRDEKNQPTVQQKLSTILHRLAYASAPESFAEQNNLSFLNGKVKVFIYFMPDAPSSEKDRVFNTHSIQLEKKTNDLAGAWAPVKQLIPLSKEPVIRFISPPKTLKKTNGHVK